MQCFEILIAQAQISKNGGPFINDQQLTYYIPDEAQEVLGPILGNYNLDPEWYFDRLNGGRPPAPWAIACLDREYEIAGHVVSSRPPDARISFTSYKTQPRPLPDNYYPGVGPLVFYNKAGLEKAANNSPLFASAWTLLKQCSENKRWLVVLDPLPEEWLSNVLPGDHASWLEYRS